MNGHASTDELRSWTVTVTPLPDELTRCGLVLDQSEPGVRGARWLTTVSSNTSLARGSIVVAIASHSFRSQPMERTKRPDYLSAPVHDLYTQRRRASRTKLGLRRLGPTQEIDDQDDEQNNDQGSNPDIHAEPTTRRLRPGNPSSQRRAFEDLTAARWRPCLSVVVRRPCRSPSRVEAQPAGRMDLVPIEWGVPEPTTTAMLSIGDHRPRSATRQ